MPALGENVAATERKSRARTNLVAHNHCKKEASAVDFAVCGQRTLMSMLMLISVLNSGEQSREKDGIGVQGRQIMIVVELEALNEGAVEQCGGQRTNALRKTPFQPWVVGFQVGFYLHV